MARDFAQLLFSAFSSVPLRIKPANGWTASAAFLLSAGFATSPYPQAKSFDSNA
jgi:hypothetical protein